MSRRNTERRLTNRFSRRDALRLASGAGAVGVAASFGVIGARPAAAQTEAGAISIPDTGVQLPTEEVTFRWVDSGDQKAVFFREFFPKYSEKHQNITVQYDGLPWNEIQQLVPIGVQSGNAPDVFQVPLNVPGPQAVTEGWVAPLDDIIPNFAQWKAAFPPGAFVPGITDFNGKTYGVPLTGNRRYNTLLLYNADYMQAAGYDPTTKALTWDEFRDAARKITEAGRGQYFGLVIGGNQVNQWSEWVGSFARIAGAPTLDWKTGQYNYAADGVMAALDLLLAMKDDGSIFPGAMSMNAPQARESVPQGTSGMIIQGPWNIPLWQTNFPDFNLGVGRQPVPNSGTALPLGYAPGGSNNYWVYANSPLKPIAGDIFAYLGSEQGQIAWGRLVGIGDPPIFPSALEALELNPQSEAAVQIAQEHMVLNPEPLVRNPEIAQVFLERKPITPDFAETLQGIFAGQLSDPRTALQDVTDRENAELDRAIEAARAKGAQVSREDWVFPNWDPMRDYTEEDYAAL